MPKFVHTALLNISSLSLMILIDVWQFCQCYRPEKTYRAPSEFINFLFKDADITVCLHDSVQNLRLNSCPVFLQPVVLPATDISSGTSMDWVASLGVEYVYTIELRDRGWEGFFLSPENILPTVSKFFFSVWSDYAYVGKIILIVSSTTLRWTRRTQCEYCITCIFINTSG